MASRLVDRLDQALLGASDPLARECLKAERAAALARLGFLSDSRLALAGLKTKSRRLRQPRLNAWMHLVDGLIDHFGALAPEAKDKFEAARREAKVADDRSLQAQASAWLANCHFNARHPEAMADALIEALRLAAADDHITLARVALVRADASRLAGFDDPRVQVHYNAVRLHAAAGGDTAMISALLYNRATSRNACLSLDDAFGNRQPDEAHSILVEASSIENFDQGLGNTALASLSPLMRAQLCVVLERWDEALALFDAHLGRAQAEAGDRMAARYTAERAWCHVRTGRWSQAQADADMAERLLPQLADLDDIAVAHARLARSFESLGKPDRGDGHWQKAHAALRGFRAQQALLAAALKRVDEAAPRA